MNFLFEFVLSSHYIVFPIILASCLGSLCAEIIRQTEDKAPLDLKRFASEWIFTWFAGALFGYLVHGTVAPNNQAIPISCAGFLALSGRKEATKVIKAVLGKFVDKFNKAA